MNRKRSNRPFNTQRSEMPRPLVRHFCYHGCEELLAIAARHVLLAGNVLCE
jgi:hypothetical protein